MTTLTTPTLTVYSKANCRQCDATKRWLDTRSVDYALEDAMQPDNLAAALELGHQQAPILVATYPDGTERHWSGFNPNELGAYWAALQAAGA